MKVFGYTDDKDLVRVDLPIDTIVDAGIDPWRVDLFDDQLPVVRDIEGKSVHFRRLRDVSFAYRIDDQVSIALRDDVQGVCVGGSLRANAKFEDKSVSLCRSQASKRSFAEHLAEYLHLFEQCQPAFTRLFAPYKDGDKGLTTIGYLPKPAQAVTLEGTTVAFDSAYTLYDQWLRPRTFMGEMFSEVQVKMVLPQQINWVFELLEQYDPIVFGGGIRDVLNGVQPRVIDVKLHRINLERVLGHMPEAKEDFGGTFITFKMNECTYRCETTGVRLNPMSERICAPLDGLYSADGVYAIQPDELRGSRIALYDVGRRQFRLLFRNKTGESLVTRATEGRKCLEDAGFKMLDTAVN